MLCSRADDQYFSLRVLKATRNQEGSGIWCRLWVSDLDSAATIFYSLLSRPVNIDFSPDIMRESFSSQGKGEVSELSVELILCGDGWETHKHLYVCFSIRPPGMICQQLYWHILNVLVFPAQFFVLVVQALEFEPLISVRTGWML